MEKRGFYTFFNNLIDCASGSSSDVCTITINIISLLMRFVDWTCAGVNFKVDEMEILVRYVVIDTLIIDFHLALNTYLPHVG